MALTIPTVHLNGTSKEALRDGYSAAYDALQEAYEVMKQTAPNGRDYYPQGGEAFSKATSEHLARLNMLDQIQQQFQDLACAVEDQS